MADEQIGAFQAVGSGTTWSIPISAGKVANAGEKVLVAITCNAAAGETCTVTDDVGSTYTPEGSVQQPGAATRTFLFRRDIVGGGDELEDTTNNNINVTHAPTLNRKEGVVIKLQGLASGAPHQSGQATGNSTTPSATTGSALTVACTVVGICQANAPASQPTLGFTPGSGYSEIADHALNSTTNRGTAVELKSQSSGTATADGTITSNPWTMSVFAYATSSGQNVAANPATETDTAQPFSRTKDKAAGIAAETDAAQPVGKSKAKALGIAAETETAMPIGKTKTKTLGIATETDSAIVFGKTGGAGSGHDIALNEALETDAAQPFGKTSSKTANPATETDSAQPFGKTSTKALGIATDIEIAMPLGKMKSRVLGIATESDSARPFAHIRSKLLGVATETDLAMPFGGAPDYSNFTTDKWDRPRPTLDDAGEFAFANYDKPRPTL